MSIRNYWWASAGPASRGGSDPGAVTPTVLCSSDLDRTASYYLSLSFARSAQEAGQLGIRAGHLELHQSQHPRDGLAASKARERASVPRAQCGDRGDRQWRPRDVRSDVSDSEVEVCWRAFLRSQNAWARVRLVISD